MAEVGSLILRFRDLVTPKGGTIAQHRDIIGSFGSVWWGWWARASELQPVALFAELQSQINSGGPLTAYLLNSEFGLLYQCQIARIASAPAGMEIPSPEPRKSPAYYPASYWAWFLMRNIDNVDFSKTSITILDCPTMPPEEKRAADIIGQKVSNWARLKDSDATMWLAHVTVQ